jgi:hypothetical protein
VIETPLRAGASAGAFSIAFRDALHGIIVGGDYIKETEAVQNAVITEDGGVTWKLANGLSGYRSVVAYVPDRRGNKSANVIAVGPSGADYSTDDGQTWRKLAGPGFDTLSFPRMGNTKEIVGWAAGNNGALGRLSIR